MAHGEGLRLGGVQPGPRQAPATQGLGQGVLVDDARDAAQR